MTIDKAVPITTPGIPVPLRPEPSSPLPGSDRVAALDWLKGFMMLWILYTHLGAYWGDGTWTSAWRTVWVFLDWMGPVGYIAFTVIGTMLSIAKKGNGHVRVTRPMRIDAFKKFFYIFVIGELMNLLIDGINPTHLGPWHVLGMNMITAVAFAQLFVYGLVGLSQRQRVYLFCTLLAASVALFGWCMNALGWDGTDPLVMNESKLVTLPAIMYFILFDMNSMMPVYGWLLLTPLTMIVFESITRYCVKKKVIGNWGAEGNQGLVTEHGRQVKKLAIIGFLLVIAAFLAGGFIVAPGIGGAASAYGDLTNDDPFRYWFLSGIPLIIYRFSPHYIVADLGIVAMVFAVMYRTRDKTWLPARAPTRLELFGKYSFSIFVYSHALALVPLKLSIIGFATVLFPVLLVLVLGVQAWDAKAGGVLSLEWGMRKYLAALNWVKKKRTSTSSGI
jgi:hypothetical protein